MDSINVPQVCGECGGIKTRVNAYSWVCKNCISK